jgi:rSAM/selenodomain-associated transferase 1
MPQFPADLREICAVAIVAKESRPGLSKTRLTPPLTPEEAAEINSCFLLDTAANLMEAGATVAIQGFVAYHPAGAAAFFRSLLPAAIRLLPPREAGLGPSLRHGCRDLLALGYGAACIINSDSPTLPAAYLSQASRALARPGDRVVLGPSADGGYYLVGVKQAHDRLFEDVAWSTEVVLHQTVQRAAEIGLEVELLPEWYDVDDAASLHRLCEELSRGGRRAVNTAAYLKRLAARHSSRRELTAMLATVS